MRSYSIRLRRLDLSRIPSRFPLSPHRGTLAELDHPLSRSRQMSANSRTSRCSISRRKKVESVPRLQDHDGAHQRMQPHDVPLRCRILLQLWLALVSPFSFGCASAFGYSILKPRSSQTLGFRTRSLEGGHGKCSRVPSCALFDETRLIAADPRDAAHLARAQPAPQARPAPRPVVRPYVAGQQLHNRLNLLDFLTERFSESSDSHQTPRTSLMTFK